MKMKDMARLMLENKCDYIRIDKSKHSKDAVIVFSHTGYPPGKFAMTNALKSLRTHKIYVNCPDNSWYQEGIKGATQTIDESVQLLSAIIDSLKPSRVICVGMSMGGYAALLFGLKLKCDAIISFTPEIEIGQKHGRSYISNNLKKYDSKYTNLSHLINYNRDTQIYAIYGVYDIIDLSLLWQIEDELVNEKLFKPFFVMGDHRVTLRLDVLDIIKRFLEKGKLQKNDIHKQYCVSQHHSANELFFYREIQKSLLKNDQQAIYDILKNQPLLKTHSQLGLYFGIACMDLKKYNEAENIFNHIVKLDPNSEKIDHLLGLLYHVTNKFEEAKFWYSKSLEIEPNAINTIYRLGAVELALKNYVEAEKHLKKALELNKEYAEVHFHLGVLLMSNSQYKEAEYYFKNAVKYEPNNKRFKQHLETIQYKIKDM